MAKSTEELGDDGTIHEVIDGFATEFLHNDT